MFFSAIFSLILATTHVAADSIPNLIPALEALQQVGDLQIPQTQSIERAATVNQYGYTFYHVSPLAKQFINDATPGKTFVELGCGFSNITEQCLRNGVSSYIANDMSFDHLKILALRLQNSLADKTTEFLKKLQFMPGRVPDVLPAVQECYDAILSDKMIHFLNPEDAKKLFIWAHKALKPGGKLYLFTSSPYCSVFQSDYTLGTREQNKDRLGAYAGHVLDLANHLNTTGKDSPNLILPTEMLLFSASDLRQALEDVGFEIEQTFITMFPTVDQPEWQTVPEEKSDFLGMIARKN